MEDSNISAKYIEEYDFENKDELNHVNDFNINNYNYGDLIATDDYRDIGTYIIGKKGKVIKNPDYSSSGYLTIPYEISPGPKSSIHWHLQRIVGEGFQPNPLRLIPGKFHGLFQWRRLISF